MGLHNMSYTEWGARDNRNVLICVHGLTRNGRDFDDLASALVKNYRIICPDVVGRGRSDWLRDPSGYIFQQYVADMMTLIARLNVPHVHWLGTSMGGLIGMFLASMENTPITRLVLNDVGPVITAESLRRIGEYLGKAPKFANYKEAEKFVRATSIPFGNLDDMYWRKLTESSIRETHDGGFEMRYDPGIREPFNQALVMEKLDLWPVYDRINCPTLVVRGADSDLLTPQVAHEMSLRGPKPKVIEIPNVGHAPMFMDAEQIAVARDFLLDA
ncbi:MAG: alpha/beta hydrolase [Pseudomonadota bacterium]